MERYFCLRSPRNFLDPREFIIRKGRFLLSLSNLFGKFLPLRDGDLLEGDRVGIFWGKFLPEGRGKSKREMDGRRGIFAGVALVIGSWELIGLVGAANGRPGTPAGISWPASWPRGTNVEVESRLPHGSQIGLAKGAAVESGGWPPGVSLLCQGGGEEEEGVIRGCSWGGTAINAGGVVPAAPLSNFYI